jgi:hypothetical protein
MMNKHLTGDRLMRQLIYVGSFGVVVAIVGVLCLQYQVVIGPVVLALTIAPLLGLLFAKRSFKGALPDLIFGAIDTGILVIPALCGGILYGIAGAIAGGVIGDALTDGIAGFFEGGIAKWLREKGIEESREPIATSLGKMAGCLFGAGFLLSLSLAFGIRPSFT